MAMSISFSSSTFLTSASIPLAYSPSNFRSLNCFGRQKRLCISRWPTIRIRSEAVTLPVLTFDGERAGETCLDIKSARPETARAVVHRGVVTELQNRRRGTASTLTRAEVRGGGRKPYPQKKMGRARRGSQRTPLRRGGGVIFGPKPRDWSIKMNKKEKRLAITTALMSAAVNTVVVEDFDDKFLQPKTKDFIAALKRWGVQPTKHSLIFSTEVSDNVRLSSRNIGTLKILTPRNLNLYDVLRADKLILTKSSVEYLNRMYGLSPDVEEEEDQEEEEEDDDDDEGGGDLQIIPESADKNEGIGSPESAQ